MPIKLNGRCSNKLRRMIGLTRNLQFFRDFSIYRKNSKSFVDSFNQTFKLYIKDSKETRRI